MKFSNQHSLDFTVCLFVISQNFGPMFHSERDVSDGAQAGVNGDSLWCPQFSEGQVWKECRDSQDGQDIVFSKKSGSHPGHVLVLQGML